MFFLYIAVPLMGCWDEIALDPDKPVPAPIETPADNPAPKKAQIIDPVVNTGPTKTMNRYFLTMKDFADMPSEAQRKQKTLMSAVEFIVKKHSLPIVAPPVVWKYANNHHYFVEVGIPLAKRYNIRETGCSVKETKASKAVVAHYFGPYSHLNIGYDSIEEWLKENKKKKKGIPWEVYVSDPNVMKDLNFLQTDIYQEYW